MEYGVAYGNTEHMLKSPNCWDSVITLRQRRRSALSRSNNTRRWPLRARRTVLGTCIEYRFNFRRHARNCEATISPQSDRRTKAHSLFRQQDRRSWLNASIKLENQYGCGMLKRRIGSYASSRVPCLMAIDSFSLASQ